MRVSESKSEWSPYTVTEKRPCEGRHSEKVAICKPGRKLSLEFGHAGTVILDFQSPELWENKYLLLKAPSLQYLVMAAQAKTFPFSNSSVALSPYSCVCFFTICLPNPKVNSMRTEFSFVLFTTVLDTVSFHSGILKVFQFSWIWNGF